MSLKKAFCITHRAGGKLNSRNFNHRVFIVANFEHCQEPDDGAA